MLDIPFKGLMPYSESDAQLFFGRENDKESIIDNLKVQRLTILYGESGVGKSSVLRAGVAHKLRQEIQENLKKHGVAKLVVVVFPPDPSTMDGKTHSEISNLSWQDAPLSAIKIQIEAEVRNVIPEAQIPDTHLSFIETLQAWTESVNGQKGCGELLIILDQFEQYFLYHPFQEDKELQFDDEFSQAINHPSLHVNFLIAIREDELAKLDRFQELIPKLSGSYLRLEHLDRKSARDAVTKPIDRYNQEATPNETVQIEPQLVDAILDSITQYVPSRDGLAGLKKLKSLQRNKIEAPYLQLMMKRLWKEMQKVESNYLRLDTLIQLSDIDAKDKQEKRWSAVKNIIREHLNDAMSPLSEFEMNIAANIFRYLVTPSGAKYAYSISDLGERYIEEQVGDYDSNSFMAILERLLEKLATGENRIIRPIAQSPDQPISNKRYEIFHDALAQPILDWRRRYLDERRITEERQRRITAIKQGLPAQALRQNSRGQNDLSTLLARQAYLFNQRDQLGVLEQADYALRQALSHTNFSSVLKNYSSAFSSIAFSPDQTTLAAASLDGKIHRWNRENYYFELPLLNDYLNSEREKERHAIAFSPDGLWLASSNLGHTTIRLWNLRRQHPVAKVLGDHQAGITAIAFSPIGYLLASSGEDQTVKLWNWRQLKCIPTVLDGHPLRGRMGVIRSLAFNADGTLLAVGCEDRTVWIWDVQDLAHLPNREPIVRYGHEELIHSVVFSPSGKWLASASDDHTIRLWDLSQNQTVPLILQKHTERVRALSFSPDGKTLASASDDQTIRLWNMDRLDETPHVLRGHTFDILSLTFSPDSQFLASGGWDNTVRIWDLRPPNTLPKILKGHKENVRAVCISPYDHLLASGGEDGEVRVWNLKQLDEEPVIFQHGAKVFGVAVFVSGDRHTHLLAAGGDDNIVSVWDLQQLNIPPIKWIGHQETVSSVAFSPNGYWLASGSWDSTVRLWKLHSTTSESIPLKGHSKGVTSIAFSPDGKILASASDDKTILLWNMESPDTTPVILKNHNGRVWSVAFSPDGKLLASASDDWTVRLWNLQHFEFRNPDPEKLVHVSLKGHSAWVSSVTFSPDGTVLASGSFDRSIRLWQIDQIDWNSRTIKEAPIVLENHNQSVTSVAFTSDGQYLASGSFDNTVRIWITSTRMLADTVCQKVLRNLYPWEWQQFMGSDIPYEYTCSNLPNQPK